MDQKDVASMQQSPLQKSPAKIRRFPMAHVASIMDEKYVTGQIWANKKWNAYPVWRDNDMSSISDKITIQREYNKRIKNYDKQYEFLKRNTDFNYSDISNELQQWKDISDNFINYKNDTIQNWNDISNNFIKYINEQKKELENNYVENEKKGKDDYDRPIAEFVQMNDVYKIINYNIIEWFSTKKKEIITNLLDKIEKRSQNKSLPPQKMFMPKAAATNNAEAVQERLAREKTDQEYSLLRKKSNERIQSLALSLPPKSLPPKSLPQQIVCSPLLLTELTKYKEIYEKTIAIKNKNEEAKDLWRSKSIINTKFGKSADYNKLNTQYETAIKDMESMQLDLSNMKSQLLTELPNKEDCSESQTKDFDDLIKYKKIYDIKLDIDKTQIELDKQIQNTGLGPHKYSLTIFKNNFETEKKKLEEANDKAKTDFEQAKTDFEKADPGMIEKAKKKYLNEEGKYKGAIRRYNRYITAKTEIPRLNDELLCLKKELSIVEDQSSTSSASTNNSSDVCKNPQPSTQPSTDPQPNKNPQPGTDPQLLEQKSSSNQSVCDLTKYKEIYEKQIEASKIWRSRDNKRGTAEYDKEDKNFQKVITDVVNMDRKLSHQEGVCDPNNELINYKKVYDIKKNLEGLEKNLQDLKKKFEDAGTNMKNEEKENAKKKYEEDKKKYEDDKKEYEEDKKKYETEISSMSSGTNNSSATDPHSGTDANKLGGRSKKITKKNKRSKKTKNKKNKNKKIKTRRRYRESLRKH